MMKVKSKLSIPNNPRSEEPLRAKHHDPRIRSRAPWRRGSLDASDDDSFHRQRMKEWRCYLSEADWQFVADSAMDAGITRREFLHRLIVAARAGAGVRDWK